MQQIINTGEINLKKLLIKITKILLILSFSLLCFNQICIAETNKALKIGVVNTKELENCLYIKDLQQRLEKEFTPRKNKFESMQKELQSKTEMLQRDKEVLSDKERISRERELTKLQQDIQHMLEGLDSDFKLRRQEELVTFNNQVEKVLSNLANQQKYDLILPDQVVMYSANLLDCTPKVVAELDGLFDLVFIDADKKNYMAYYELIIDKVRSGGLIIADNVLWSGKVTNEHIPASDKETHALLQFNTRVHEDPRVFNVLLPLRDGLMLLRKK